MKDIDRRPEKLQWISLGTGVFLLIAGLFLADSASCTSLYPAAASAVIIILFSLCGFFRSYFQRKTSDEKIAFESWRRNHTTTDLFDGDEALKAAERAEESFIKYAIPAITLLIGAALIAFSAIILFQGDMSEKLETPLADEPLKSSVLSFSLFLASIISGSFFVGVSRERHCRWLRPAGAMMFFTGVFFLLSGGELILEHAEKLQASADLKLTKFGSALTLIIGVEIIVNFIIEFYRPRTIGELERPLFESRFLSLITEPGGVAKNFAASINYQFGFEVSDAWFYRFMEKTLLPMIVLSVFLVWLMTCFVIINPDEKAIRERFGAVTSKEELSASFYFKLPWPLETIRKFPVGLVQTVPIGYSQGDGETMYTPQDEEIPQDTTGGQVILWTKSHRKEEYNFIVAGGETRPREDSEDMPVTVNFISASIPLYFKVKNLYDYFYRHENDPKSLRLAAYSVQVAKKAAEKAAASRKLSDIQEARRLADESRKALYASVPQTLEEVASREVTRYLLNVDFNKIMTEGRVEGSENLREAIQAAVDDLHLGVEIVFVGLQGLHPPVKVGKSFNEVVASIQEKQQSILEAEKYAVEKKPGAKAEYIKTVSKARQYSEQRTNVAKAQSKRYLSQLTAYRAAPQFFVLNNWLDFLETEASETRKYIVTADGHSEVITLNLEEKIRPDLLNLDLQNEE